MFSRERFFDYEKLKRLSLKQKKWLVKGLRFRYGEEFKFPGRLYHPIYSLDVLHNHDHALMIDQFETVSNLHKFFSSTQEKKEFKEWLDEFYQTVDLKKPQIQRTPLIPKAEQTGIAWEIFNRISKIHYYDMERMFDYKLSSISPQIDSSIITVEQLLGFSELKMNVLQEYFNDLSSTFKIHPRLQNPNKILNFQETLVKINSLLNTLVSIDVEAFERNTKLVTEIGICIFDPLKNGLSQTSNFYKIHILIKERLHLRNGNFVPDNKNKFLGGSSLVLHSKSASEFIQEVINHYFIERKQLGMQGILVGHNINSDIKWLKQSLGIKFPLNMDIVDSQKLFQLVNGESNSSVGAILRRLDIPHSYLHNAGNDAYYTLLILMKLCDPLFRNHYGLDDFKKDERYTELLINRNEKIIDAKKQEKSLKKRVKITEFIPSTSFIDAKSALYATFGT